MPMLVWLVTIPLLGGLTGLRTMTPIAVVCWFAWRGDLAVQGTWGFWCAQLASVIVFTLFALGELYGDKLPQTPNRTAPGPLAARLCFGGLVGALAATGLHGALLGGVLLGATSALAGSFLGFHLRRYLVKTRGMADFAVALVEDAIAIFLSILALAIVTR
jgi:uncharacterized membrane protein